MTFLYFIILIVMNNYVDVSKNSKLQLKLPRDIDI